MKSKMVLFCTALAVMAVVWGLAGCPKPEEENLDKIPVTGITLTKKTLTLALSKTEKLSYTITPENADNQKVTWSSDKPTVATVAADGTVTAAVSGTAKITVKTEDGDFTDVTTVTVVGNDDIMALPAMKTQFAGKFLIGNIINPGDISGSGASATISNTRLTRHFNALTAENNMKPSYLISGYNASTNTVTWNTNNKAIAVGFVNAAQKAGIKLIGHTLLWHSQNASWMTNIGTDKNAALTAMKTYITAVVGDAEFKGKIYSWDVLNEIFPDGVSASATWTDVMRKTGDSQAANPWYVAIGSDFVYEGFLAARKADPNAILYYNDYNMDQVGKATMVRNMVQAVNNKYRTSSDKPAGEAAGRLLIEGIGMQSHHNTNVQASSIKNTLELFKPLGVKISISELDVLAQGYSSALEGANKPPAAGNNLTLQATRYGEYMKLFLEYSSMMGRVSIWGITDDKSWRAAGEPLLFDKNGKAKPAYISFIKALE
jgi:endo-1,4-beta-xylanase